MKPITCIFIFLLFACIHISAGEDLSFYDPQLVELRKGIKAAWDSNKPAPTVKCSLEDHIRAMRMYSSNVTQQKETEYMAEIQGSVYRRLSNNFIGLEETLDAIKKPKDIKYILVEQHYYVNVIKYFNIYNGRTINFFKPFGVKYPLILDCGEAACYFEMRQCIPLPLHLILKMKRHHRPIFKYTLASKDKGVFMQLTNGIGGMMSGTTD